MASTAILPLDQLDVAALLAAFAAPREIEAHRISLTNTEEGGLARTVRAAPGVMPGLAAYHSSMIGRTRRLVRQESWARTFTNAVSQ